MLLRLGMTFLAALVCAGLVPTARGEPAPEKAEALRTDATGDPLPPGVVARLGTTRLFQPYVHALRFSPDGKTLAAVNALAVLTLWEVRSGKKLWQVQAPPFAHNTRSLAALVFSADGKLVALGCEDKCVRLWETATGKELAKVEDLDDQPTALAFDPRGGILAIANYFGGPVRFVNLETKKVTTVGNLLSGFNYLAYSADGKVLTALRTESRSSRSPKTEFRSWNTDDSTARGHIEVTTKKSFDLSALAPDGSRFAVVADDGKDVQLLDPATGKEVCRTEGTVSPAPILCFSGDGKRLAASGKDRIMRVWDAAKGKLLHQFKIPSAEVEEIALSCDSKLAAFTTNVEGAIRVWDVAEGKELHSFAGHRGGPLAVAFSADGKNVYTASRDTPSVFHPDKDWAEWSLRKWDAASGKELHVVRANFGASVHFTTFSHDARLLAVVTQDGTLRLWDTDAAKQLRTWKVPTGPSKQIVIDDVRPLSLHIWTLDFGADGKTLFASSGRELHRWDTDTGTKLAARDLPGEDDFATAHPGPDDGTAVAFTGKPTRCELLNLATGRRIRTVGSVNENQPAFAYSPDGRTLAVSDTRTKGEPPICVTLWEAASGRERGGLDVGRVYAVAGLAFAPDGTMLAVGGDGWVRLFHLASGREVGRLVADHGYVSSLTFSPDGKRLAVGGDANTVLIADVVALTAAKLPKTAKFGAPERDALWTDLASADGAVAYRAVRQLAAAGGESTAALKERLKTAPEGIDRRLAKLIVDLDDNAFEVREKASAALQRLEGTAAPALRRALETTESAEVRTRARRVLGRLKDSAEPPTAELIRLRALEAVANMGTPEARELLKELANGDADDRVTLEAEAALKRLERR